jgi:glycosyltransferase involved in cell wall biosynthesis
MAEQPRFSVIVATFNRPQLLETCVRSVLDQRFPARDFELIVVDDGDGRGATWAGRLETECRIKTFHQERGGWGKARWLGADESRGRILVFLDDDCQAQPGWLAAYACVYDARPEVDGVGGGLRLGSKVNIAGHKQYRGHMAYFNRLNEPLGTHVDRPGPAWFTFGGNRSFKRAVWRAVQEESPDYYFDDYRIDLRLKEAGATIYYEPLAWVTHHYCLGLGQRLRAAYRYGRSTTGPRPPAVEPEGLSVIPKGRRLVAEYGEYPRQEVAWYGFTQPLVWLARLAGRLAGRAKLK